MATIMTAPPAERTLAVNGGTPVRGAENPLPMRAPRIIHPAAYDLVKEVLDSGFTADFITKFEREFAAANGVRYGVAQSNCTSVIHAVVGALEVGPGDEVIVSPITDYGSLAGVVIQGATPVFPDVDPDTGLITAEHVAEVITPRTKAIIAVHFYGQVCEMDPIVALARRHNLVVIEDVCQAIFAEYKGQKAGSLGDVGCFTFDGGKLLCAEHGGMALSDDEGIIRAVREFGIDRGSRPDPPNGRVHLRPGYNFRWGNMEAAVALAQLKLLPAQNRRRIALADKLSEKIAAIDGVQPPCVPRPGGHVYWLYHMHFELERFRVGIEDISRALAAEGLPTITESVMYYLVPYSHHFLANREADIARLTNARSHLHRTVRWGFPIKYTDQDLDDIAEMVGKVVDAYHV